MDGQAGRHRVDPDAVGGDVQGRASGQRHDPGLGRGVVRLAGLGPPAEDRGVVDHGAAVALGDHLPQHGPGAAERAGQRDVEDPLPLVVGHVQDGGGAAEAGVVDEDVDAAESLDGGLGERADLGFVGDVAGLRGDPAGAVAGGELIAGRGQPALVLVAEHDLGALGQAAPGDRGADAGAGRGGDHDDLAGQQVAAGRVRRGGRGAGPGLAVMAGPAAAGRGRARR